MSTMLGLLFLGGVIAVIVIGMCISLYFYTQNTLGVHPFTAQNTQTFSTEQITLERTGTLYRDGTISASSRYAKGSLTLIACVVFVAILVIVSILIGVVH